ncbi:hypothetical protein [Sphingomonas sp. DT-204]|uniref:hypothetical protein n=1 Tax=Sphingomonas sp. DT-204 TaxID=3396166 RepID=UPI003F1D9370
MKSLLPALAAAALLPLAACNNQPEVVDTRSKDPLAEQIKNAPPVELPPAMEASVTFRCKDNSLVYVDFFQGHKQANLRTDKAGSPIQLKADAEGNPYQGDGYTMTGDKKQIDLTAPGKGAQSCKA